MRLFLLPSPIQAIHAHPLSLSNPVSLSQLRLLGVAYDHSYQLFVIGFILNSRLDTKSPRVAYVEGFESLQFDGHPVPFLSLIHDCSRTCSIRHFISSFNILDILPKPCSTPLLYDL